MSRFIIQHGAIPLAAWDLKSAHPEFFRLAIHRDGKLIVGELDRFDLVIAPVEDALEYRVFIGDAPIAELVPNPSDVGGVIFDGKLFWRAHSYFESARSDTIVRLESREQDTEEWTKRIEVTVFVLPTKLGEEAYQEMANSLQRVSRSLLIDLYGKSRRTYDLRFAKEHRSFQSKEEELESVEAALSQLGVLLPDIERRPASRIARSAHRSNYWGQQNLRPRDCKRLARRCISLEQRQPVRILREHMTESFDVAEHRILKAFLRILQKRAEICAKAASEHCRLIEGERHLRDIDFGEGPSIYEAVDLPRIRRLNDAGRRAARAMSAAESMARSHVLLNVPAELIAPKGGAFQRSAEYRQVLRIIRAFLLENAMFYEGEDLSAVTKLTSRLFEHWSFLRIVESFREAGLQLQEWNETLRENLRSMFIVNFERGLQFEGQLSTQLRLRMRYEPWVFNRALAEAKGETLFRGMTGSIAWSPDIVLECLRQESGHWVPIYAIVMDCKYSRRITDQHWSDTKKYLEIRSTQSRRQVARQLWLISPCTTEGIASTDSAVTFDDNGPSCPKDESVCFSMLAAPIISGSKEAAGNRTGSVFQRFAAGTMKYLRSQFA